MHTKFQVQIQKYDFAGKAGPAEKIHWKIEYLPLGKPTAANILTMLVWRWGLSIDAKISGKFNLQFEHLHC